MNWLIKSIAGTAIIVMICACPAEAGSLRTVALSDVASLAAPLVNARGQVAFRGSISNPDGSGFVEGIWSEGTGSLRLVAGRGQQAPGLPTGAEFLHIDTISFNDMGHLAFTAQLESGSGGVMLPNTQGIWSEGTGSLQLVAMLGGQAPGLSSPARFSFFFEPVLSNSGDLAFGSLIDRGVLGDSDNVIWTTTSGSLSVLAIEGGAAPGVSGVFRDTLSFLDPGINQHGRIAFDANLRVGGSVTNSNDRGIWSDRTGSLQLVAREGSRAPSLPFGANFSTFGTPVLNAAGNIVFEAGLATGSGGVDSTNNGGIWSDRGGELSLIVRKGETAPTDDSTESLYFELFDNPVINHGGHVAFAGRMQSEAGDLSGSLDSAIWAERDLGLELVAREGDQAPGAPLGAVFDDLAGVPFAFNARGQVAFLGQLKTGGGGVSFTDREGIWATDLHGELQLIARVGDLLAVAPGDVREIRELLFVAGSGFPANSTGNEDGRPSGFNERGELTFAAQFTDLSGGVFVSSLVVPEPVSAVHMLLSVATWWFSRNARQQRSISSSPALASSIHDSRAVPK